MREPGIVTRCDRCDADLDDDTAPESHPAPGLPLPARAGSSEAVRFCPLCLAELGMMGATGF